MGNSLKVKDDIYWVGALDFDIRIFDIIMRTEYGTTYNSFILKGSEKNAIIEVSKEAFFDEFIERVKDVIDPAQIDYIILNHTEPDHTGSLSKLLEICPKAKVVGTGTAINFVKEILNYEFDYIAVKDGDTLSLGDKTLNFFAVPFLHWPDSMYTYVKESKTIFTCDSFGCHYCSKEVFNDRIEGKLEDFQIAYKYYFDCIMGPFKSHVLSAINKIEGLEIETICNGHGPVIRENPKKYIDMYREWATVKKTETQKVVVVYASAYGYTKKMAEEIAKGIKEVSAINVLLFDVVLTDKEMILGEMADASGLLFGSATLVGDTLPPITNILAELNPVIHKGKIAGAFGSYGWSGEAVPNVEQRLKQLKFKIPVDSLKINFNPSETQLESCFEFGKQFGEEILMLK